ncbi:MULTISPECIES: NAD(P)H-dependent oxidoreductase [unclassified Chryseobacterium]|uniref:NAD(P)H-dependent oxidoreductase n=1 Tax=unclassified Chryseobacterium TaxID=2593645 RepID=UPI0009E87C11|nr:MULTISPECIES: NAD(P)H-dependent oxidoreductase [unclassified Chryseobacterium]
MYQQAIKTLEENGHEVKTSDLYRMNFDPVSDRINFTTVKNTACFSSKPKNISPMKTTVLQVMYLQNKIKSFGAI